MSNDENQKNEDDAQPSFLQTIGRQAQSAGSIAFFILLQWGIDFVAHATGKENEWWAICLLNGTTAASVIVFFIVAFFEILTVFAECRSSYLKRFGRNQKRRTKL